MAMQRSVHVPSWLGNSGPWNLSTVSRQDIKRSLWRAKAWIQQQALDTKIPVWLEISKRDAREVADSHEIATFRLDQGRIIWEPEGGAEKRDEALRLLREAGFHSIADQIEPKLVYDGFPVWLYGIEVKIVDDRANPVLVAEGFEVEFLDAIG